MLHQRCQELGAYLSLLAKGTQFPGLLGQVGGGMTRGWRSSLEAELVRVADDCVSVQS